MKIGVIGASGYAGGELLRLLAEHPHFEVEVVTAFSQAGEAITSVHPHLTHFQGRTFSHGSPEEFAQCELIFLALPHGESAKIISGLPQTAKLVDLGADYRLENPKSWETYYGGDHAGTWTYGLPELPGARKKISESTQVANPGCYATAIALASAPALAFVDSNDIVVVAASGTTGAGRSAKVNLLGSEVMNSLTSYKFGGVHQHTPEIEESLTRAAGIPAKISFTPILAPMPRGILATVTAKITKPISQSELHQLYVSAYKDEPFVTVLPIGAMPKTSAVLGSNHVHLQVAVDAHTERVVISAAIDNLGKGAAGQAIQNANIICGFKETDGLAHVGVGS